MVELLSDFPYVIVRIACTQCAREGTYKLARLVGKYGPDIELRDLLENIASDCKWRKPRHPYQGRCGAYFRDLRPGAPPPDLPPGAAPLKLIVGGKKF